MDIAAWLRDLGFAQYEGAFRDNDIDADVLRRLTAGDLRELGIASIGHRRRLLDAIALLSQGAAMPTEAPAPAEAAAPAREAERRHHRHVLRPGWLDRAGITARSGGFARGDRRLYSRRCRNG